MPNQRWTNPPRRGRVVRGEKSGGGRTHAPADVATGLGGVRTVPPTAGVCAEGGVGAAGVSPRGVGQTPPGRSGGTGRRRVVPRGSPPAVSAMCVVTGRTLAGQPAGPAAGVCA